MMFLDFSFTSIGLGLLRYIGAGLCNIIYGLISRLFQLFMIISQLNILSSDEIQPIYQRITLILTIVMFFYITFQFVKYIVEPDAMTDKEKGVGNVVKRMLIAIVLIAFVPKIFTIAYDVQNKLITNQVFSKVLLGEANIKFDTFGSAFSADVLGVFYGLNDEVCSGSNYDSECKEAETKVNENLRRLREDGEVTLIPGITGTKKVEVDGEKQDIALIRFDGLLAVIIGGFILYIVVLYTVDVATRYAQLIFLQIMSPIAIIGYISPKKDGIFNKWLKQCTTTYLDLFIRLSIIYFVLLIIDVLGDSFNSGSLFAGIPGVGAGYKTLAYIVLIMGLLVFAKKAPKMIGDLLPSGGAAAIGYGFKGGERFSPTIGGLKRTWNAGKRTVGGAAGVAVGVATALNKKNKAAIGQNEKTGFNRGLATAYSATKAATRGLKAGAGKGGGIGKANAAARQSIQKDVEVTDKGGTVLGHDFLGGHYQQKSSLIQRDIKDLEAKVKAKDNVASAVKEMKVMKTATTYKEDWDQRGFGEASERIGVVKAIEKQSRIYAVSAKDAVAQDKFKVEIKKALDKVYTEAAKLDQKVQSGVTLTSDEQKIVDERNSTLNSLYNNLEIGSTNWNIVENEIVEAKRVSTGQEYSIKDKAGNIIETKVVDNNLDIATFAEDIGDIADTAKEQANRIKYEEETRRAQANAKDAK